MPMGSERMSEQPDIGEQYLARVKAARRAVDDYTSDPLSPDTKRTGNWLLLTSLVALAMTLGGVVPERVTALGITSGPVDRSAVFTLLGMLLFYLVVAFSLRVWPDYHRWKANLVPALTEYLTENMAALVVGRKLLLPTLRDSDWNDLLHEAKDSFKKESRRKKRLLVARALVDYLVPILMGILSMGLCFYYACRLR